MIKANPVSLAGCDAASPDRHPLLEDERSSPKMKSMPAPLLYEVVDWID